MATIPNNSLHALVFAIHEVKPAALQLARIDCSAEGLQVVTVSFELTPELIKAWGEQALKAREPQPWGHAGTTWQG